MRQMTRLGIVLTAVMLFSSSGGAQCPNHWVRFGDSCYAFLEDTVPWTSALVMCRDVFQARMLEVETQDENDFITGEMRVKGMQSVWQGINDLLKEGEWVYVSNKQHPSFLPWGQGEPNSSTAHEEGKGEDCVVIRSDGRWNDLWCEDIYGSGWKPSVVCEKQIEEGELIG